MNQFKSHSETNAVKMFIVSYINTRELMKRIVSEKKGKDMEKKYIVLFI